MSIFTEDNTMKLIIDRAKWLRGEGGLPSYLLRKYDNKMCCVGFYLKACGMKDVDILSKSVPSKVVDLPKHALWLVIGRLDSHNSGLLHVNDTTFSSEDERENKITEIFAQHDVQVEFV